MTFPPLANAELAVMELLWDESGLTARKIRETLYPDASKAQHGTVQRLLQRLEEKGFVSRDKSLPVHIFSAAVSREAYASGQLESLTAKLTGGSIAPLITHLLNEEKITPEEIRRLRSILEARNNGRGESS
jgi:BlaI family penicillinase repressor